MLTKLETILANASSDDDHVCILIANAVPLSLRGSRALEFLVNHSWKAVMDFDPTSESGGLHSMAATASNQYQLKLMEITQFQEKSITNHPAEIGLHSKNRPWIFTNGRQHCDSKPSTFIEWLRGGYRKSLETALAIYQDYCPHLTFAIFVLSDNDVQHLATTVESLFSQSLTRNQSFYIISPDAKVCSALLSASRVGSQLKKNCFVLPLEDIRSAFDSASLPPVNNQDETEEIRLPLSDGSTIKVSPQKVKKFSDLDILSMTQCANRTHRPREIQKAEDSFYKGHEPTWLNFYHGHDIQRTESANYLACIKQQLEELNKMQVTTSERSAGTCVRTIIISHHSGSGGTTVGRRLLWDLRGEYRCAEITRLADTTRKTICDFQAYGETMVPQGKLRPIVLLTDSFPVLNLQRLLLQLERGKVKCVVIQVQAKQSRLLVTHGRGTEQSDLRSEQASSVGLVKTFELSECLDKAEINRVKNIIRHLEGQDSTRVAQTVEQSKLFIYLGLELFGGNYDPKRLKKFVKQHVLAPETTETHRKMLYYCSLVYIFSRKAIPCGCFQERQSSVIRLDQRFEVDELSPIVNLLLICHEQLDPPSDAVYKGYRPAHALVAREILQQRFDIPGHTLSSLCHEFLQDMLQSTDYATRHLMDLTIILFRKRAYSSETAEQEDDSSSLEFQDHKPEARSRRENVQRKAWQRENRYSPLIRTVLAPSKVDDSRFNALKLIFSLCQTVIRRERDDTAYVWQLMARLLAYEYQGALIPFEGAVQLSELLGPEAHGTELVPFKQDIQNVSGCTAALICIKQAIKLISDSSSLHATKGLAYKLMLYSCFSRHNCSHNDLSKSVSLAIESCNSYEKAREYDNRNWHAYIGEIEVCITLLEIAKDAEAFQRHEVVSENNRDFSRFLAGAITPPELFADSVAFLRSVSDRIQRLLDKFFQLENTVKELESYHHGEDVLIKWLRVRDRMSELQRKFYSIIDRKTELGRVVEDINVSTPRWSENHVRHILSVRCDDSAHGTWHNVGEDHMQYIIRLLKVPIMRSDGADISDYSMVAFVRACLECQEKPDVESKLLDIVQQWAERSEDSEWAHYFNYMLHFPHECSLPGSSMKVCRQAQQACNKWIQRYGESKKSKPRYFLGRERGLGAFVPARILNIDNYHQYEMKTDFWRSSRVTGNLVRLWGIKYKTGYIRYREGLQIKFDNSLFPTASQERLYFYVGFTFHGMYAFDPLSEEAFKEWIERPLPDVDTPSASPKLSPKTAPAPTSIDSKRTHGEEQDTVDSRQQSTNAHDERRRKRRQGDTGTQRGQAGVLDDAILHSRPIKESYDVGNAATGSRPAKTEVKPKDEDEKTGGKPKQGVKKGAVDLLQKEKKEKKKSKSENKHSGASTGQTPDLKGLLQHSKSSSLTSPEHKTERKSTPGHSTRPLKRGHKTEAMSYEDNIEQEHSKLADELERDLQAVLLDEPLEDETWTSAYARQGPEESLYDHRTLTQKLDSDVSRQLYAVPGQCDMQGQLGLPQEPIGDSHGSASGSNVPQSLHPEHCMDAEHSFMEYPLSTVPFQQAHHHFAGPEQQPIPASRGMFSLHHSAYWQSPAYQQYDDDVHPHYGLSQSEYGYEEEAQAVPHACQETLRHSRQPLQPRDAYPLAMASGGAGQDFGDPASSLHRSAYSAHHTPTRTANQSESRALHQQSPSSRQQIDHRSASQQPPRRRQNSSTRSLTSSGIDIFDSEDSDSGDADFGGSPKAEGPKQSASAVPRSPPFREQKKSQKRKKSGKCR